jgi:peptidoglycan/LPS O-acetylase OafA/YrhL
MNRKLSDETLQLDALDGLRGFAALLVVLSHTSNRSMFFFPFLDARGIGKSGVFLFFLLSSFLLSRALIKQGAGAFTFQSMNHYAQRRLFRIYPLYIPYLLLGLLSTIIISLPLGAENTGVPFALSFREFIEHILLMEGKGVTWSIAVEFKFYFVLPVLIFLCHLIRNKLNFIVQLLFLMMLVLLSQIISPQSESLTNDVRLLPYMSIFLFGTILASIQCEIEAGHIDEKLLLSLVPLSYISVVILLLMTPTMASLIVGPVENNHFHQHFLQYTLLWSVVLLSIVNFKSKLSAFFEMKWLCFYGALSFSIYLFHTIFAGIANKLIANGFLAAWFVLLASTATSYLTFKLLELPASKFKLTKRNIRKLMVSDKASS